MAGRHPATLPELTLRGMLVGMVLTMIFTASNVYLGLKVGLTFSSSIPAAVISMVVLRLLGNGTLLENNLVQTQASAAGTLSAVIFILPGLVMAGHWHGFPFWETMGICMVGGMLGVLFTIPLRRVMVVQSALPYPEGVAAAEILRAGYLTDAGDGQSRQGLQDMLFGSAVAAVASFATSGLRLLSEAMNLWLVAGTAVFRIPIGFSYALLGAGYLIGIGAGVATLVGLVVAWGVAVPVLTMATPVPDGMSLMDFADDLWDKQVRFLGVGAIAVAALWTLGSLFMPMMRGIRTSFQAMHGRRGAMKTDRTDQDLPPAWIMGLAVLLMIMLGVVMAIGISDERITTRLFVALVVFGTAFAFVFGFFIAAACGYMAGLIGSSSSPISGIGIVAIITVSMLLLASGTMDGLLHTPEGGKLVIAVALFVTAAIIAIASIANDNLQDLKTGYLLGATPWKQQVALMLGCVVGAMVIPPVLNFLYHGYGFSGALPRADMDAAHALSAPQAALMTAIVTGIFTNALNWTMIHIGMGVGVVFILLDYVLKRSGLGSLPALAIGMGIYLPPEVSMTVFIGALLSWGVGRVLRHRKVQDDVIQMCQRRGTLIASGLIVGESMVGVLVAGMIGVTGQEAPFALVAEDSSIRTWLGAIVFLLILWSFAARILRTAVKTKKRTGTQ